MSAGMPELGSKISLISKADIRYEGRLFTVDPQECTIALASVRSFGTEDRETQYPVAPQNQVYDYILFRGSDIKDIRVLNNVTLPNDPAIMQLSVPPSLGQQQYQPQGFSHPVLGHIGPQIGQFNTAYGTIGTMGGLPSGLAPGMSISRDPRSLPKQPSELIIPGPVLPPDLSPAVEPSHRNDHDLIGGASRSTTPASLGSRKSPTIDQGVQVSGPSKQNERQKTVRPIQPPGHRNPQREIRDSRGEATQEQQYKPQSRQPQNRNQNQQYNQSGQQGSQSQRQAWVPRGQARPRGRGRSSAAGTFRQQQQQQPNQQGGNNKPKNTLKFENDYDFEQANTEFEELRSQLGKMKLEEPKPDVNGDSEKKDDSGNETGAGEGEQEEEHEIYYDKSKSFFDNISCEAVERSKGRSQRTDWRTERKLNSETFGVASARRGSYRGRGGYYNRGMSYRGGYRGGYRNQVQRRDQQNKPQPQSQQSAQSSVTLPQSVPICSVSIPGKQAI